MTPRTLLVRGMLVGLAAAALAMAFATLFGEPQVARAIAFEAVHDSGGDGPVSRTVQATLGLAVAIVVYGTTLGGAFALAFAFAYGRVGSLGVRGTACWVAAAGFLAVTVVPFLKYPANPPAVGEPDTIRQRTVLYFTMLLVSVLATIVGLLIARSLTPRLGGWNAALVAIGAFLVLVGAAAMLLPAVDEVPADFPASVLWRFRVASLGTQLVLWSTFGLLFGALTDRAARRAAAAAPAMIG